ncbi:hypothetical protein Pint_30746 [Pistacia integerrima]|uniref:Uncharacterized protein n=1 Tax=Pistacia integerrima TaxID=434235 RepID=A0ACC0X1N5_9ROSI|nr:hypothetical protein Pint_30746 [Pistacia integerrima]
MLSDSVRDLEEWECWSGNSEEGSVGFKEKVIRMAKEKGDNGKIEARRGGLDMLGSADAAFRYLVESFPRCCSGLEREAVFDIFAAYK